MLKVLDSNFKRRKLEAKVLAPPNFLSRWLMKNPYSIRVAVKY
jgi:hypothetical protein